MDKPNRCCSMWAGIGVVVSVLLVLAPAADGQDLESVNTEWWEYWGPELACNPRAIDLKLSPNSVSVTLDVNSAAVTSSPAFWGIPTNWSSQISTIIELAIACDMIFTLNLYCGVEEQALGRIQLRPVTEPLHEHRMSKLP